MADSTRYFEMLTGRLLRVSCLVLCSALVLTTAPQTVFSPAAYAELPQVQDGSAAATAPQMQPKLMREGSTIDKALVTCRASGDNLQMEFAGYRRRMSALENLASQRILKAVIEDAQDTAWVVSGTVTEFKGHNYLLITRAQRGRDEPTKKTPL